MSLRKGHHEGLITLDEFNTIQRRIKDGARAPARKDISADFPLRGFVCCDDCDTPPTACWPTSKSGVKRPYYLCHAKGCPSYRNSIRRYVLESEFAEVMQALQPSQNIVSVVTEMFKSAWSQRVIPPFLVGITDEHLLVAALGKLPSTAFTKSDFAQSLADAGLSNANGSDLVRRVMPFLKRQGLINFDDASSSWSMTAFGHMRLPHKTMPLLAAPTMHLATIPPANRVDQLAEQGRLALNGLACFTLLTALVGLNASFAWELGREAPQFQILFTMGVMALDMMRPGFVMIGLYLAGRGRLALGSFALAVALVLSPVFVLSTTSILSASFLLGAEINSDAVVRAQTREALRIQHQDLLQRAAQDKAAWRQECARGGCGPLAKELEAEFQLTMTEAKGALNQIVSLTEADESNSELLARMVSTFEGLGLFGAGRQVLLPLFLAISLELGALFGPALLLRRRG